jgi:signal transduction histidine kinase
MWGALTIEHWMRALAAAVLLALGVAVLAGRRASRLRLPFVALCVSLFSWNLSSLAYQLTRHREFHVLDRALSPLTVAAALHFVVVFVGRRKKLGVLLLATYAWFGGLAIASWIALVGEPPLRGRVWALLFLVGLGVVIAVGALLLVLHLRIAAVDERGPTQRVLVALVGGMVLGSTELLDNFGLPLPPLGAVGTLFAAVVLAPLATRTSPLGEGRSSAVVLGAASAVLCVVLYLGVFELLGNDTLALVLGTTTLTLLLIVIAREVITRTVRQRARRDRLAWMGRMSDQLAHDLQNPLAAMRGAIQLLQEDRRRGRSLDERADLLGLVDDQIARMIRVIEKYRRLGRVEPELRELDASALVADVVGLLRHRSEHEIVCELADLAQVRGDPELLAVAVENLIVNAVDASADGGRVWVSTSRERERAIIEVRDEGEGMNERTLESVFDEFFTTKAEGTGLGLTFVKRVMDVHRGEVSITSRVGAGTRVRLSWPIDRRAEDVVEVERP